MIKQGAPVKHEPVINVKSSDLQQIKKQATSEAVDTAFLLMLGLPLLVLRDKHGFGKVRLERFIDDVLELYDSFNKDYLTLEDIHQVIHEETGVTIQRR